MFSPTPDEQVGRENGGLNWWTNMFMVAAEAVFKSATRLTYSLSHHTLSLIIFHAQVLKQLARTYADAHETMSNNDTERCGASFYRSRGIINGALWYSFAGGEIQHFSYNYNYTGNHVYAYIACE